uniref:Transcriptional regulator, LuxR family n=1 Tax=Caulobacter sp. (strain K31) TaxID=366602 RepID=B0T7R0_CAUSK
MSIAALSLGRPAVSDAGSDSRNLASERRAAAGPDQGLRALAHEHGFYSALYLHIGHAACGRAAAPEGPPSRLVASSPIALRQYGEALTGSSIARRAAGSHRPFAWTNTDEDMPGLSGRHVGLAIPVQDHAAGPGLVALIGQDLDRVRRLAREEAAALAFAAAELHQSILASVRPAATAALTAREIECLRFAAVGRTVADTGQALGITSRTVEFHLKNVAEKLDATNKVHAVAIAVSQGLVSLRG